MLSRNPCRAAAGPALFRALALLLLLLPAGLFLPGCGESATCNEACMRVNFCLDQLGIPFQDIYAECVYPCNAQNPVWKVCVLHCDIEAGCLDYALCLTSCGYFRP